MSLEAIRIWVGMGVALYVFLIVTITMHDGLDPLRVFVEGPALAAIGSTLLLLIVQLAWFVATGAFL